MSSADADMEGMPVSGKVGRKLKSRSGWETKGHGDNSSGFTGFPGGLRYRYDGFAYLGYYVSFWSSTNDGTRDVWRRTLETDFDGVGRSLADRRNGFSVRCLMNE